MEDKLNITISVRVEGKEGLNLDLKFENTSMKQVLLVEGALLECFKALLTKQARGEI